MRGTIKERDGKEIRMIKELVPDTESILYQHIHGCKVAVPVGKKTFVSSVNQEKVSGSG
jgi:hypothetical protein